MRTFLLAGHAGLYNRGCEAIVRTTVSLLREEFGDVRIILSSFDHERDRQNGLGSDIAVIPAMEDWRRGWKLRQWARLRRGKWTWRSPLAPVDKAMGTADAVLSVGGDNYTVDYGPHAYFWELIRLAKELRRPLVVWGASVGPFPDGPLKERALVSLRQADLITARESMTVQYLAEHGIASNVRLVADSAFLLPPDPVDVSPFWPDASSVVGLNISQILGRYRDDKSNAAVLESAVAVARYATSELGYGVLLIPHVTGVEGNDDCEAMRGVLDGIGLPGKVAMVPPIYDARQTKHIISQCRFFVGARTHATIAALSSGVPTVSIAYSRKAFGINRDVFGDLRYVADVREMRDTTLISALRRLQEDEQDIRTHLATVLPNVIAAARSGVDHLAGLLAGEHVSQVHA